MEKKLDMLIFDLDGTLWETTDTSYETIKEIVREYNVPYEITRETVMKTMGCTYEQAAKNYFPDYDEEKRYKMFDIFLETNSKKLFKIGGNVYPNLENVLIELKEKYKLAIVSNCADGYIEAFLNSSGLEKYFDDYLPAGKYKLEKGEAIKRVIDRNNAQSAIYIGDTDKDYNASIVAGIPFIHAKYGFQKDLESKYSIDNISELLEVLNKI